jgi:hypothetical protein
MLKLPDKISHRSEIISQFDLKEVIISDVIKEIFTGGIKKAPGL